MNGLDFCCCCGDWMGADAGKIRLGDSGVEIICDACLAIGRGQAVVMSHDARSGTLTDDMSQGRKQKTGLEENSQ